jgi:hypothetical protein
VKNSSVARYKEGDWFGVPLPFNEEALGLAAHVNKKGLVFGYFFGPPFSKNGTRPSVQELSPEVAIWKARFVDSGLKSGRWPILASDENWSKAKWPLPPFAMYDPITGDLLGKAYCSELDLMTHVKVEKCSPEEARKLPIDSVFDELYVVETLSELLQPNRARGDERRGHQSSRRLAISHTADKVEYFTYFPSKKVATQACRELEKSGFTTNVRKSAAGNNWLVLVANPMADKSSLERDEKAIEHLVESLGGEYDGFERPTS